MLKWSSTPTLIGVTPLFLIVSLSSPPILAQNPAGPPNGAVALLAQGLWCGFHALSGTCSSTTSPSPLPEFGPAIQCRRNPKVTHMAKVAFLGLGVMGFPMAGHLVDQRRARGDRVQPHRRPRPRHGPRNSAARPRRPRKAAAEGQDFVMACVGNDDDLRAITHRRRRRLRRHEEGRDLRRSHHRLRRGRARTRRGSHQARLQLRRRPGVGRPGRRRKRRAHRDVRRQRRRLCRRRAGDRGLCADVQAARARRAPAN